MNFTVVKSLDKQKTLALYPDVSEQEMYAIGKMSVSWALLESQLIRIITALAEQISHTLPSDFASNSSLRKILTEFKTIITSIKDPNLKAFLESVLKRVNNLKTHRHMLTHGIFTWALTAPEMISVHTPKAKQQPQRFNAHKIAELARKIAELNFEIRYPDGEKEFLAEKVNSGYSVSRKT